MRLVVLVAPPGISEHRDKKEDSEPKKKKPTIGPRLNRLLLHVPIPWGVGGGAGAMTLPL